MNLKIDNEERIYDAIERLKAVDDQLASDLELLCEMAETDKMQFNFFAENVKKISMPEITADKIIGKTLICQKGFKSFKFIIGKNWNYCSLDPQLGKFIHIFKEVVKYIGSL